MAFCHSWRFDCFRILFPVFFFGRLCIRLRLVCLFSSSRGPSHKRVTEFLVALSFCPLIFSSLEDGCAEAMYFFLHFRH